MVEMSAAAGGVLSAGEADGLLLARLSILAPLALPAGTAPLVAVVSVSPAGQAEILSESRQASRLHCSCHVATMPLKPSGALTRQHAECRPKLLGLLQISVMIVKEFSLGVAEVYSRNAHLSGKGCPLCRN